MARKICTAGVVGSFSFVVLEQEGTAVSSIRDRDHEIVTRHIDLDIAEQWTEKTLCGLIGRGYEID